MKEGLTRRDFFKSPFRRSEIQILREGNVVHIRKRNPEGNYTIIYENHVQSVNPTQLPESLNGGLVLETPWNWSENPLGYLYGYLQERPKLFPPLEKNNIPIFFVDFPYSLDKWYLGNYGTTYLIDGSLVLTEGLIGAELLFRAAKRISGMKSEPISRRKFVENLGRIALGVFLLMPFVSLGGTLGSSFTKHGEGQVAEYAKLTDKVHLEAMFFSGALRNVTIAHKEEWLMNEGASEGHLATIIGAGHVGIENWLEKSSQERLEFLSFFKPLIKRMVVPEPFYQIAWFEFKKDRWKVAEIFEVPELKALVA